jgi:hypothetical protein
METRKRILLNYMPFANPDKPAIGLSLLKAECATGGYKCDIQYGNLFLAAQLGYERYRRLLQSSRNDAFGDYLFTEALYDRPSVPLDQFLTALADEQTVIPDDMPKILTECRRKIREYLDFLFGRIAWRIYDIVGFSCSPTRPRKACQQSIISRLFPTNDIYPPASFSATFSSCIFLSCSTGTQAAFHNTF